MTTSLCTRNHRRPIPCSGPLRLTRGVESYCTLGGHMNRMMPGTSYSVLVLIPCSLCRTDRNPERPDLLTEHHLLAHLTSWPTHWSPWFAHGAWPEWAWGIRDLCMSNPNKMHPAGSIYVHQFSFARLLLLPPINKRLASSMWPLLDLAVPPPTSVAKCAVGPVQLTC